MRICLVDDDFTHLEFLNVLIGKWAGSNNIYMDINFYHSAEEMLFETGDSFPYDLIILDIQMDNMSGIELAKRIRKTDKDVTIAFVSGMADYVFEGYEVQAIRYILKPVNEEKVFELLDFVLDNTTKASRYLIVSVSGENKRINYDDILYVESMGHYVVFHLDDREYDYKYNISDLCLELPESDFIRTHRSYIVNLKYVESITRVECHLSNNIVLPLSRNSYKEVNQKFIEYHRERGM